MQENRFILKGKDGKNLHAISFIPDRKIKAVIQIAHGMAEHKERYRYFAEKLTEEGYAIFINDHRGHGETSRQPPRIRTQPRSR